MSLPMLLTSSRILLLPVAWLAAFTGRGALFTGIVAVAAATDILDGLVARWQGTTSVAGARLDTVADAGYFLSAPFWVYALDRAALLELLPFIVAPLLTGIAAWIVKFSTQRRLVAMHLYSSKIAAACAFALLIALGILGIIPALLVTASILAVVSHVEEIAACLMFRRVPNDAKSIFLLRRTA
ncbi:CDP-alcohol phosphatidyltransferase family protein [Candidatus Woesearchaeota archaeon]|nr:CDP-alcohol phosphatidyltransferase family protein [Candidatus Woesearchaeota archaeon]